MTPVEFAKQAALGKLVPNLVKSVVRPTVKPKPTLLAKAKPLPQQPVTNKAVKALNYVANVPAGERFMQRPVANTMRLARADGLPFARRTGQAVVGLGVGSAGLAGYGAVQNLEDAKERLYQSLAEDTSIPPEKQELFKKEIDDLTTNAVWRLPLAAGRRALGLGDAQTQAQDRLLTNTAWEGAKSMVHLKDKAPGQRASWLDYAPTNYTPSHYAVTKGSDSFLKSVVPKPDPVNYAKGAVDDVKTAFPDLDATDVKNLVTQKADEYYGIKLPNSAQSPKPKPTPLPVVPTVKPPAGPQTVIPGSDPLTMPAATDNRNQAILAILTLLAGVGGGGMLARSLRRRKRRPTRELYESELA